MKKDIITRLSQKCKETGTTTIMIADKLGISDSYVSKILNRYAVNQSKERLMEFAKLLGVSYDATEIDRLIYVMALYPKDEYTGLVDALEEAQEKGVKPQDIIAAIQGTYK